MAAPTLETAPVLSTPDTHIFEDPTPPVDTSSLPRLSDEQIQLTYEIQRTVKEIRAGRWRRIALQFPDHMLVDAPRVYEALSRGLQAAPRPADELSQEGRQNGLVKEDDLAINMGNVTLEEEDKEERLFILGDTSYGACCVDEVAAEHVDADVVVHYGRSCLSPPSRLPVIYVFTARHLDLESVIATFKETYPDTQEKIVLMADIPYSHHILPLQTHLQKAGYTNIHATEIVHDPSSLLPNRTTPPETISDPSALRAYHLFHISDPPPSLLLILSSRVSSINIYPTDTSTTSTTPPTALAASSTRTLNRRYALLTSLTTTPIFGILINTLSVKNYLTVLAHVQRLIASAGKKSYTFVVGKINAAKVANFSEIGGWVVIGCWESSLIESKEFWRPIITPFELALALQGDEERVWTGEWKGDFEGILEEARNKEAGVETDHADTTNGNGTTTTTGGDEQEEEEEDQAGEGNYDSEEESAPPEFDLRTGRYVSHSRPMRSAAPKEQQQIDKGTGSSTATSSALTKRANGDLAHVGGVLSPGAEFLRSKRTWVGLGSDYREQEDEGVVNGHAARVEEGRSGIARGYVVGDDSDRH